MPHSPPPAGLKRRQLLARTWAMGLLASGPGGALARTPQDSTLFTGLLRRGGCAVLIRHAQTEPGIGDPPGFRLDDCRSQRQLSLEGRAQSRRLGQWFAARQLVPHEVLSSPWCRCRHTAEEAFGRATTWPALGSTFGDSSRQPSQTHELRERLTQVPAGRFEVWVTHQVNMTDLVNEYPSMGEAFLVLASGRLGARLAFS